MFRHQAALFDLEESPFSVEQEAIRLVSELHRIELPNYRVVGGIVRYEQSTRNSMKDTKQRIVSNLSSQPFGCDNYLIWAPPGSGKSFFIQEIARSMGDHIHYWELGNLEGRYDRKFENVFSLQKEIALKVVDSLRVTILAKESKELGKKPTQSLEAYTLYLKGRAYRHRTTLDSYKKTIEYCEKAIQKDPNYAQAFAEIARCYAYIAFFELLPSSETYVKAEKFAEKAIQLDPSVPESHIALGSVLLNHKWDFRGAEIEYTRALELSPNLADGHLELAILLIFVRRFDEGVLEIERALELDPLSASTCSWAGTFLFVSHRYDEAIEVLGNVIELYPNSALAHDNLGQSYVYKGMFDKGISEIKRSIAISGGNDVMQKNDLADAYVRAGKMDEARNVLADLLKMKEQGFGSETAIAGVYVSLGEKDKAIEWLQRAYERHIGYLVFINCDPTFDDLRPDPRFQSLLKKIGFRDSD
jgi:adenylate cyclase